MALTDKNIVITPNTGSASEPEMVFSGADASNTAKNITAKIYPTNGGTLSFEGSSGQLFSIVNSMTGAIYSVNDVSGIPSIEVLDTGIVKLAQYSGNVLVGTDVDDGVSKLQVNGTLDATKVTTEALEVVGGVTVVSSNGIRQQGSVGSSGYGTFWRQDGDNLYLMVTDINNAGGGWNGYRPFVLSLATGVISLVNPVLSSPLFNNGYREQVGTLTGTSPAITVSGGSVKTWTLSAASTPTVSLTSGQSIILVITPGSFAITWPTILWTKQGGSGTLPALFSAGKTSIILWMVGSTLYGSHLGDTA
jgi:hypothetical protein